MQSLPLSKSDLLHQLLCDHINSAYVNIRIPMWKIKKQGITQEEVSLLAKKFGYDVDFERICSQSGLIAIFEDDSKYNH